MSKKFRVTFDCDNGYYCMCCRSEWTEHEDYESEDEVIDCILACRNDPERSVSDVREIGPDLSSEMEKKADAKSKE